MVRVKRGTTSHRRHRKLHKLTKGYRGQRSRGIKKAKEALMKAGMHAYRHRRMKKRDFRGLWIVRLNAALKARGVHYNRFIRNMEEAKVILNRKVLSELAIHEPEAFDAVVDTVMSVESTPTKKPAPTA